MKQEDSNRILAVLDRYPFPPRDGISYPIAHHLRGLAEKHVIDLALLGELPQRQAQWFASVVAVRPGFRKCLTLEGVAFGQKAIPPIVESFAVKADYDVIYCASGIALQWAIPLKRILGVPLFLNLNDSISMKFRRQTWLSQNSAFPVTDRLWYFLRGLRKHYMPFVERSLLSEVDKVFLQTTRDADDLVADCGPWLASRTIVAPNGASVDLFENQYNDSSMQLVHVGTTRGHRGHLLLWFVRNVFEPLRRKVGKVTLNVYGDVAPPLRKQLGRTEGIRLLGFVPNLVDAYSSAAASVVPAFMTNGLINRVVDSMAAGVPCTGLMAFNGIPNFQDGIHGIEVSSAEAWISQLYNLLNDRNLRRQISDNGRKLVRADFDWDKTISTIGQQIAQSISS